MPNRIIKESLLVSASYAALTLEERDLFVRLIVAADDYGRYDGRLAVLRGKLMPLEEVSLEQVEARLKGLEAKGLLRRYEAEGQQCVVLTGWERHQIIRAKRSRYPSPEPESNCMQAQANFSVIQSESESKSESESQSNPTQGEVEAYCLKENLPVDAGAFVRHYDARRWRIKGEPIRDWQGLCRAWANRGTGPPKLTVQQQYTQRPHHEGGAEEALDAFLAAVEKGGSG